MHTVELLFPIPIFKTKIENRISEEGIQYINTFKYGKFQSGTYSMVEPDKISDLLDHTFFSDLKKEIEEHLTTYTRDVFKYDVDPYITNSWINMNPQGTVHNSHFHSNSLFSGVFYHRLPKDTPGISFMNPLKHIFEIWPSEWNHHNSYAWELPVEEGDLIIFPSSLYHEVKENLSENLRVTLSFNSLIRGEIGSVEYGNNAFIK